MKPRALPRAISGFLLLFLLLFSVTASAARLEVDRKSIAVDEITTVHLKGAPFIAVVSWEVSPELEIIDSDKKHARVRGLRAGAGTVKCDMNLSVHSIEITVRDSKPTQAPVQPPPPVYQAPANTPPPAYTAPTPLPVAMPAATPPTSQMDMSGTWQIDAAGYKGKLELSRTQGMLIGRVWFDAHAVWEPLEEMYFDEGIGELSFIRPGANQAYRGRLRGAGLEGHFTQGDGRDYTAGAPSYPWSANRSGGVAPATSEAPGADPSGLIARLSMDGKVVDQVSGLPVRNQGARPTHDRQGNEGGALLFDGKAYLELDLDINPDKRPQLTIAAWVRADSGQPTQQVASHDNGGYDRSLSIDHRGGGSGWSAFTGSGGVLGVKPVRVGEWTFVAAVWDQATQKARLYVDDSQYEKSGNSGAGHGTLRIGMNPSYGEYFRGAIDELWVFDRALTPDEIASLRGEARAAPVASGIAGTWNINANNYTGQLELSESAGRLGGQVWFDAHRVWEELRDIEFDGRTLRFLRPGPSQRYEGSLSGDEIRGRFDQSGGGGWNWSMTRSVAAGEASLRLERDRYAPGEFIVVTFTAPESYADNAWIGIIPSQVPHGSEAENDRHDLSYQYLKKRGSGSMTFVAPKAPGSYDLRLHDTDNNGREVASVSFRVDAGGN